MLFGQNNDYSHQCTVSVLKKMLYTGTKNANRLKFLHAVRCENEAKRLENEMWRKQLHAKQSRSIRKTRFSFWGWRKNAPSPRPTTYSIYTHLTPLSSAPPSCPHTHMHSASSFSAPRVSSNSSSSCTPTPRKNCRIFPPSKLDRSYRKTFSSRQHRFFFPPQ